MSAKFTPSLDQSELNRVFADRHTTNYFSNEPVPVSLIKAAYDDARWAPTSMNMQSLRLNVLHKGEERHSVAKHMSGGNKTKTIEAPLTVIGAYDPAWHKHMDRLFPAIEGIGEKFEDQEDTRHSQGRDNAFLQIGYFMTALRARGLEIGPMTGVDMAGVDEELHSSTGWKSLIVINIGRHADTHKSDAQYPRADRFTFEEFSQVH